MTGMFDLTTLAVDSVDTGRPEGGTAVSVTGTATGFSIQSVDLIIIDSDTSEPADFFDLSLSMSSVAEDSGTTNISVTASLPGTATNRALDSSERQITVAVQGSAESTAATATAGGTDFTDVTPVTITIAANANSGTATFDLVVTDDADIEGDEILVIAGAATASTETFAIRSTTLTITDNDIAADAISLSLNTPSVAEDIGTTTVMVTAQDMMGTMGMLATAATITVALATGTDAGTATMGAADADPPGDFTLAPTSVELVFAVNDASMTGDLVLTVHNDEVPEGDETLVFTATTTAINPATGVAFVIPNVTLTITDNDTAAISVSLNTESVAEGSTTTLTVTAAAPAGTLGTTTPTITFALLTTGTTGAGTATMGAADANPPGDFTLAPASVELVFATTDTSMTGNLVLTVHSDAEVEGDETLVFAATTAAIDSGTSAAFVIPNVTLTITDAGPISVSLDTESVAEDSGTTTLMVTAEVASAGALATTPTITFALLTTGEDAGTATMGAADADPPGDFTLAPTSVDLVFAATDTSMTGNLVLTVHNDEVPEGDETLVFTATTAAIDPATTAAFVIPNVTLTISDGQLTAAEIEEVEKNEERIQSVVPELARASVSTVVNTVASRIGTIAAGSVRTGFANSLAETLASNEQGLNNGTLSLAETLAGSQLSLGAGQADPDAAAGVWASADYERMSSKSGLEDWDGSQISLHAGVDRHISSNTLVGMAAFWSKGKAEFDSASNDTDTRLLGVNPYFGWHSEDGTRTAWGTVGYSEGDLEQKQRDIKTDLSMAMLAVGGSRTFEWHTGIDLSIKGDLSTATISADSVDSTGSPKMTSKVHRARLAVEASNSSVDPLNRSLERSASLGLRRDSGDGDTGYGAELEAEVRWTDPGRGLTLAGTARLLPLHSGDLKEWGIGGLVRYQPAHGRGLNVQLQPSYRPARSDSGSLWETEISDLDPAGEPEAHLEMDTGYGIAALSGQALVTPYSGVSLSEDGDRNYRLGTRIGTGSGLHVDLAGSRRESGDGEPEHGIGVNLDLRW